MNRYLLFSEKINGVNKIGWESFAGTFGTIEECESKFNEEPVSRFPRKGHVVDILTKKIVKDLSIPARSSGSYLDDDPRVDQSVIDRAMSTAMRESINDGIMEPTAMREHREVSGRDPDIRQWVSVNAFHEFQNPEAGGSLEECQSFCDKIIRESGRYLNDGDRFVYSVRHHTFTVDYISHREIKVKVEHPNIPTYRQVGTGPHPSDQSPLTFEVLERFYHEMINSDHTGNFFISVPSDMHIGVDPSAEHGDTAG